MRPSYLTRSAALLTLIAVQVFCTVFFIVDVTEEARAGGPGYFQSWHFILETLCTAAIAAAIVFEVLYLLSLLRRKAHLERSVSIARGALHEVIEAHYRSWGLTPAEQDVATFTIKGCSIAQIAELRGSAQGTVKSQLNAIYRKAGVSGRTALLALLIEDLLGDPLIAETSVAA